eukprot:1161683-Pelagomonas_calceolata.AAC.3
MQPSFMRSERQSRLDHPLDHQITSKSIVLDMECCFCTKWEVRAHPLAAQFSRSPMAMLPFTRGQRNGSTLWFQRGAYQNLPLQLSPDDCN